MHIFSYTIIKYFLYNLYIKIIYNKKDIENNKEDIKCAPSKNYTDNSCFTLESLQNISIGYNNAVRESKIKSGEYIDVTDNKKQIVRDLTNRLENVCSNQICWLKQTFVKQLKNPEINNNTFKPKGPQGKFEWLNTTNINEVVKQYEKKHSDFKFLGTVPLDFENLPVLGIKDIDFNNLLENNIGKIGLVINLDEHWKSGSHWVALYSNLDKGQIYFFDSYGKRPYKHIRNFIKRISRWSYKKHILECNINDADCTPSNDSASFMVSNGNKNKIEKKFNIDYNRNRHQFKNSECGVYSINFILRLLEGESFEDIITKRTLDDAMNNNRNIYFRYE